MPNEFPYDSPAPEVSEYAKKIAILEIERLRMKVRKVLKRDWNPKKFGFTIVCNACGGIRVGQVEVGKDGEYWGTELKCNDCGARG